MKTEYQNDFSKCAINQNSALPVGVLELSGLVTLECSRNRGHATKLLNDVCSDADDAGAVLVLMPDDGRVQGFYGRFGFAVIQVNPVLMARSPQLFKPTITMVSDLSSPIYDR